MRMKHEDGPEQETEVQAAAIKPDSRSDGGAGDLRDVFEQYHRRVFQAAYRVTGNAHDAEDVLQTVFLRLARRERHGLDADAGSYLHRAAVNAALDIVRARKSGADLDSVEAFLADTDPNKAPDRRTRGTEIRDRVREAVARLNPRTAEVFTLRYFEGYDNHEIARMLGTSRSTVAVMLHRARKRLQEEIRGLAPSADAADETATGPAGSAGPDGVAGDDA